MEATSKEDSLDNKTEEEEVHNLPGYRFHPTDEELVGFYLRRKVEKKPLRIEIIRQVDIYKYDPWDLPKEVRSSVGDEKEWYYFCKRGRKYRNSMRPNRVTAGSGFWKATGIDKPIYSDDECIIGLKKSLVYYRGSAGKGTKTDWMMHEFRLPPSTDNPNLQDAEVWTLCRILKRIPSYRKNTPSLKDRAADTSSKSCSLESENSRPYLMTFKDSDIQQNGRKPIIIGQADYDHDTRSHLFPGQPQPAASAAQVASTSLWVHNGFANGNWDDLRSVVQFAMTDPSTLYHCT